MGGGSYSSAEKQFMYSSSADWAKIFIVDIINVLEKNLKNYLKP